MANSHYEVLAGLEDAYDQIQKVAVGGMAEVYRGRQKGLDRAVAIKRIRPELRDNKDIQERFRREARACGNLLHQNLAHVYDYRADGDDASIIMEYIDGWDLAELLERKRPIPPDVATMIAVKILSGLAYVHSHGMVHRDLKPDNIRISTRGEVKLMDFGIAFDPGEANNLTQPGILIGSPHYLSPEQVTGSKIDPRADLFAFGICLYEMLTGRKPFYETQSESVFTRIHKGEYTPILSLEPNVPAILIKVVESCLQVIPQKRPKNAEAVAIPLQDYLAALYAAGYEARLRRYLMETGMLQGKPELIDVGERTGTATTYAGTVAAHRRGLGLAALIGLALGAGVTGLVTYLMPRADKLSDMECRQEAPAIVPTVKTAEPLSTSLAAPTVKPKKRPVKPKRLNPHSVNR